MKNKPAFPRVQLKWPAVIAGVFCLSLPAVTSADAAGRPCTDDAARLCKDVQPGEGRVAQCLREHKEKLSAACKENMAKARKKAKKLKNACDDDARRLCKDIKPGKSRVMQCLKQREGELSQACREKMAKPRAGK